MRNVGQLLAWVHLVPSDDRSVSGNAARETESELSHSRQKRWVAGRRPYPQDDQINFYSSSLAGLNALTSGVAREERICRTTDILRVLFAGRKVNYSAFEQS